MRRKTPEIFQLQPSALPPIVISIIVSYPGDVCNPPRGMKFDKNAEISEEIPAFERNLDYFAVIENQVFALLSPNTASTVKFSYAALWTRIWLSQ